MAKKIKSVKGGKRKSAAKQDDGSPKKLDIAILSPKYGLLVVKVFEDDILKYEYKDRDIYLPQDKDDISLHFMSPMHAVQAQKEEIQDFHSKEILSKTLYNKSAFFLVSTTVFFCRNTDDEIRGYFYGKSYKSFI